jgi:phosphate/sulfate permease
MNRSLRVILSLGTSLVFLISGLLGYFVSSYASIIGMIVSASIIALLKSYALYKQGGTRWQMIGLLAFAPLLVLMFAIINFFMSL